MKKLIAKHVSAGESGGEYFQVMFETDRDSDKNYFLIQRAFESEWDEFEEAKPDPPYIESDDMTFCGFLDLKKVEFSRNRFYIQLANKRKDDLEISFDVSDREYQEVKEILKTILSGCDFAKIE
jgi:hypothetical protein